MLRVRAARRGGGVQTGGGGFPIWTQCLSGVLNRDLQQYSCDTPYTLRLLNALNSEDRGLKVRFSLATIAFDRESAQMSQILSSQGKNAPSNPYPHYLVRLAASRLYLENPNLLK